jgi:type IV secretory pathway TrbL component
MTLPTLKQILVALTDVKVILGLVVTATGIVVATYGGVPSVVHYAALVTTAAGVLTAVIVAVENGFSTGFTSAAPQ